MFGAFEKKPFLAGHVLQDIGKISDKDDRKAEKLYEVIKVGLHDCLAFNIAHIEVGSSPEMKAGRDISWNKQRQRYLLNIRFALFGGLKLIIPMLIMTLHQTLLTTLLTTSLIVFAVAAISAAYMDSAEPKDIAGATAAYPAVLVVFVGTGGGGNTLRNRDLAILLRRSSIQRSLLPFPLTSRIHATATEVRHMLTSTVQLSCFAVLFLLYRIDHRLLIRGPCQ